MKLQIKSYRVQRGIQVSSHDKHCPRAFITHAMGMHRFTFSKWYISFPVTQKAAFVWTQGKRPKIFIYMRIACMFLQHLAHLRCLCFWCLCFWRRILSIFWVFGFSSAWSKWWVLFLCQCNPVPNIQHTINQRVMTQIHDFCLLYFWNCPHLNHDVLLKKCTATGMSRGGSVVLRLNTDECKEKAASQWRKQSGREFEEQWGFSNHCFFPFSL